MVRPAQKAAGFLRPALQATLISLAATAAFPALAKSPDNTLVVVTEEGPATLDIHGGTANVPTHEVSWNVYDRLITHPRIKLPDGTFSYDYTRFAPELAESWDLAADNSSVTFHLRKDATFHDGKPVTAKDVKWSLDRAIAAGGFPAIQMGASQMTSPDQFVVVDDYTIKVDFPKPNKLVLANLAVPVAQIVNSELARQHATAADPWAMAWVGKNDAGGGAYEVAKWKPGSEIDFKRFDQWKSGPLPAFEKIVERQIASAGTRRALLEKGDADLSFNLPPKDFSELVKEGRLKVIGTPVDSELLYVDMNVTQKPFDNPKVRQAIAYAIPYGDIMSNALYGRGTVMSGGSKQVTTTAWPQPSPYVTDIGKAKALLAEAGYPDGFKTTISYDVSTASTREPIALLIQDSLKKIGVDVSIEKVPGADWYTRLGQKKMPFLIMSFKAWLNYPDYYFYWTYDGINNSVFNDMNYVNPDMDALIEKARFETDKAAYDAEVKGFIQKAFDDVPRIPLAQDYRDVAMQPAIEGYTYWFHLTLDYRTLSRKK
ncbi:ABC transporter substrate-binding protein [Labrys monachus]|uniref:Peptide/nickel transport system substrate-binding protein n=1 Tax=Labrys monachus TaxID=217067 RepID=A0ABU0FLC1_9HYPH|nr:ABC transporter substrate-binding protein [Labrys monachus]MDQ0394919.1 peptide/nickel transport system substrate-binding protein [Labrys monachus]